MSTQFQAPANPSQFRPFQPFEIPQTNEQTIQNLPPLPQLPVTPLPNADVFQLQGPSQQPILPVEPQTFTQNAFPAFVNPGMSPVATQLPPHMAAPVPDLNADQAAQLLQAMMSQQPNGPQPPQNDLAGFPPALPNAPEAGLLQDPSNGPQPNFINGTPPSTETSGGFFDKTWKKITAALVAIAAIVIAFFALRGNGDDKEKEKETPPAAHGDTSTKPKDNTPPAGETKPQDNKTEPPKPAPSDPNPQPENKPKENP